MKICAVIAEYNPFHLGHLSQLNKIKASLNADKIIVIMSGNFVQRGGGAILDKFTRAKHACLGGADMVIELPTVFATANAEIFAKGAVKILTDLKVINTLCFGVESGTIDDYLNIANLFNNETKEFKQELKNQLKLGHSLIVAKNNAISLTATTPFKKELLQSPNNVLGIEYVKAMQLYNSTFNFVPFIREGEGHNSLSVKGNIISASAIRKAIYDGKQKQIKKCLPLYVFNDLFSYNFPLDKITLSSLMATPLEELQKVLDCNEGLENRILSLINDSYSIEEAVEKISTKRYTKARIRRIFTANLLKIDKNFLFESLETNAYAKVLAVKKSSLDLLKVLSKNSEIPILFRKSDTLNLTNKSKNIFNKDVLANNIYNLNQTKHQNEFHTEIVNV